MKKVFLILVLFSFSLLGFSEESKTESIKKVTEQVTEKPNATVVYMTEKLQQFVESLKVPADKVFSVLVKKEYIFAWSNLFAILLIIIFGLILLYITNKNYNNANKLWREINPNSSYVINNPKYNYYSWDDGWWLGGLIISSLIIIAAIIGAAACSGDIINGIYNPEYGAIKEIIQLF